MALPTECGIWPVPNRNHSEIVRLVLQPWTLSFMNHLVPLVSTSDYYWVTPAFLKYIHPHIRLISTIINICRHMNAACKFGQQKSSGTKTWPARPLVIEPSTVRQWLAYMGHLLIVWLNRCLSGNCYTPLPHTHMHTLKTISTCQGNASPHPPPQTLTCACTCCSVTHPHTHDRSGTDCSAFQEKYSYDKRKNTAGYASKRAVWV